MDLPSFLTVLLVVVVIGSAGVLALRRRHGRRGTSMRIVDPHSLAVEPDLSAHGQLPVVPPAPMHPRGQKFDPPSTASGAHRPGTR